MTKQEIRNEGFARGRCIASWAEIPEIGARIPRHLDWVGYETVTRENRREVMEMLCNEAESADREYSPFEFTAHALNEKQERVQYDVWQEFENAIDRGIRRELNARRVK